MELFNVLIKNFSHLNNSFLLLLQFHMVKSEIREVARRSAYHKLFPPP